MSAKEGLFNGESGTTAMKFANVNVHISNGTNVKPFKILVGYDQQEDVAYEVCRYLILKGSSIPVEVIPTKRPKLREKNLYWQDQSKLEST